MVGLGSRAVLLVIASAAIAGSVLAYGHRKYEAGVSAERTRQLKSLTQAIGDMRKRHEQELKTRGWQDEEQVKAARSERIDLQLRIEELMNLPPKVLIQTKQVTNETGCNCPVVSLGDEFWLRYRAAGVRGAEADPATADSVQD
jgi:hypothetical protein